MLTWTARPEANQTGIYAERDALHFWISTAVPPTKRQEGCPIGLWIKPKVPKSDSGKNDFRLNACCPTIGEACRAAEAASANLFD